MSKFLGLFNKEKNKILQNQENSSQDIYDKDVDAVGDKKQDEVGQVESESTDINPPSADEILKYDNEDMIKFIKKYDNKKNSGKEVSSFAKIENLQQQINEQDDDKNTSSEIKTMDNDPYGIFGEVTKQTSQDLSLEINSSSYDIHTDKDKMESVNDVSDDNNSEKYDIFNTNETNIVDKDEITPISSSDIEPLEISLKKITDNDDVQGDTEKTDEIVSENFDIKPGEISSNDDTIDISTESLNFDKDDDDLFLDDKDLNIEIENVQPELDEKDEQIEEQSAEDESKYDEILDETKIDLTSDIDLEHTSDIIDDDEEISFKLDSDLNLDEDLFKLDSLEFDDTSQNEIAKVEDLSLDKELQQEKVSNFANADTDESHSDIAGAYVINSEGEKIDSTQEQLEDAEVQIASKYDDIRPYQSLEQFKDKKVDENTLYDLDLHQSVADEITDNFEFSNIEQEKVLEPNQNDENHAINQENPKSESSYEKKYEVDKNSTFQDMIDLGYKMIENDEIDRGCYLIKEVILNSKVLKEKMLAYMILKDTLEKNNKYEYLKILNEIKIRIPKDSTDKILDMVNAEIFRLM
ncbi:hypothetical protein [Criibacterium bergeronii]|uniref:Uncharacterized protein n=1 Tax=Criibacterium bergeronii TaxID=1871336 RepID=A0A371IJK7_9FIRM|nr:hypothetical protein [Criibacterium bergeronii]RDY20661.1 hypothetical protein BBG48_008910 [Criibacterium bergeronii]TRW27048.1 hypothetical protein FL857_04890 [Criibacterium bergeronii]